MNKDNPRFSRFKGAIWFDYLLDRDIIVGGAGGIGSWTSLLLSRLGCHIYIYDMDSFDESNMGGQLVRGSDITKEKTSVAIELAKEFSRHDSIEAMGKFEENSEYNPIMISCFDNMEARRNMFNVWKNCISDDDRNDAIFIDGRLNSEQYQIYCIKGDMPEHIGKYEKDALFDDSEVEDADCTFKQTSHTAAGIASHMIGFLTNFAANKTDNSENFMIPYYYEYIIPLNFTINEN